MTDWIETDPNADDQAHYSEWFLPSDEEGKPWAFVISDPKLVADILEAAGIVSKTNKLKINLELRLRLEMITMKMDKTDPYIGDVDYIQEG